MSALSSLLLAVLATTVAASNTHREFEGGQQAAPLVGDINEELARQAEIKAAQAKAANKQKPSEKLGLYEWMALLRQLGWFDGSVTEQEFWSRLDAWDEAATAAASPESL